MPERSSNRSIWFAVVSLFVVGGLVGCAQDVGDIDRTQPDKIKKSIFKDDDEWYFQQTVVDTTTEGQSGVEVFPYPRRSQGALFTAQVSRRLKRVRWEIHKNVLYARSTVEPADGVTEQVDGEKHQDLGIVAAFPIKSHFDVQRQYNTSTGEPSNVIVENRSDRPWYEREYMRVDWSTNMVTAFSSVFSGFGLMSPKASAKSARSVPQSEERIDPHRTRISEDVVDATSEYVFNPDLFACVRNFGSDSLWRCEGGTATVRNFFWRVEARKEQRYGSTGKHYKPLQYRDDTPITKEGSNEPIMAGSTVAGTDVVTARCNKAVNKVNERRFARTFDEQCDEAAFSRFERFGFFRTSKATWSPERETYDSGRKQYANRWNIWETMYDENGEPLPIDERAPEPIVFHLNAGYPKHMMESAERIESKWDRTFKKAVAVAKYAPLSESKFSDAGNPMEAAISEVENKLGDAEHSEEQMFVIKKNSCHPSKISDWRDLNGQERDADRRSVSGIFQEYVGGATGDEFIGKLWEMSVKKRKRLCSQLEWATANRSNASARFEWQRIGDLRYSFFAWIRDFNIGWLGYGPSSADPKTGEIVSASANFAGRLLEPYANHAADIVKYLNGEYSRATIEDGDHVRRQLARQQDESEDGKQQGLRYDESPERIERDDDAEIGPARRISLDPYESDRTNSRNEQSGRPLEDVGLSVDYLQEAAHRSIKSSIEADAADTRMLQWLEQPGMKEQLMSNPMMESAVDSLAYERGGGKATEDRDRRHQAYLALNAPMLFEARMERRQRLLRKENIYSAAAAEQMVEGLALYSGAAKRFKGAKHEKIANYFRRNIFYGTQLHELGHAVGLRHNFSASMDALNYHDAFWKIEQIKQLGCEGVPNKGVCSDGKLTDEEARRGGPELAKKILGDQADNPGYLSQAEHRLASVMDYTAAAPGRFAGLGKYDQAAINFAYARRVQRFTDNVPVHPGISLDRTEADYEVIPAVYAVDEIAQLESPRSICRKDGKVKNKEDKKCVRDGIKHITEDREWISIEDAVDHQRQVLLENAKVVKQSENGTDFETLKKDVRVNHVVPYRFCTDDREGRSLGCQAFDWGSNQFEVLGYAMEEFKALQPFNRYRGAEINGRGYISQFTGLQNSYLRDLLGTLQLVDTPFRYSSFYEKADIRLGAFTADLKKASKLGLNFYGELLTTPKPGRYCYYQSDHVSPQYNLNEKAVSAEGAFVSDDLYYRDGALAQGKCRSEIVRIHEVEAKEHAVKAKVNGKSFVATYKAQSSDTPADVAQGLKSALEQAVPSSGKNTLILEVIDSDVVATAYSGTTYKLSRAKNRDKTSEGTWTKMSSPHRVNKGTGEYFAYDFTPEYNYRLDRVGTYIDKVLASSRLFQLDANITFAEFATDLRATNITYWTEFPNALYRMMHGLFLGDYSKFGGGYSPTAGKYKRWKLLSLNSQDLSGLGEERRGMPGQVWRFISPSSFDIRLRLIANALAEFSTYEDKVTDFGDFLVVAATEQERQLLPETVKEGGDKITFVHPVTNRKYVAIRTEDGRSITYDLLEWANDVKQQYVGEQDSETKKMYREDLENIVAKINLVRDLREIYSPDNH